MKLSDFDYDYPKELIAKYPVEPRDHARLLVLDRAKRSIEHRHFYDLADYFGAGDAVIVNDTKVFPARLLGNKEKTGARVEVFLLREVNHEQRLWDVLVDPARKLRVGNRIHFDDELEAEVLDHTNARGRIVRFHFDGDDAGLLAKMDQVGTTPLPPYIKRVAEDDDRERYQTIFAANRGAVAAPTAGLHFTPPLVGRIMEKGVRFAPVTLHVGLGTFRSVECEDVTKHRMDSEFYSIPESTAKVVNEALCTAGCTVTAIGTTVVRAVESSVSTSGMLKAESGWTDKFIHPPYEFRVVKRLVTNFHMPKSTLLMLVSAFAGRDFIMEAYHEAIAQEYRLFSFGDAMLIL